MKTAAEILSSHAKQLDTKQPFWGNQKVTAAQAIGAMEEYAQQSTPNRDKVMKIFEQSSIKKLLHPKRDVEYTHIPRYNWNKILDSIMSLAVPTITEEEIEEMAINNAKSVLGSSYNPHKLEATAIEAGYVCGAKAILTLINKLKL